MSGLAFLLIALALSILGSLILWARARKPGSLDHGIDSFTREMQALAPQPDQGASGRPRSSRRFRPPARPTPVERPDPGERRSG
jgi:hypothetical protein